MFVEIVLAAAVALVPAAPPVDDNVWELAVYDDDPVRGAESCRVAVIEYAPAVCTVEPTSASPDVLSPGWALPYGPS